MTSRVQDRDRGARALLEQLEELERGVMLTVGVHADVGAVEHVGGHRTIAEVAAATELGTRDEAPRSFVRATIDEAQPRIVAELARAGVEVLEGASVEEAFGRAGEVIAGEMRARVPVDTGQTRASIAARVEVG